MKGSGRDKNRVCWFLMRNSFVIIGDLKLGFLISNVDLVEVNEIKQNTNLLTPYFKN